MRILIIEDEQNSAERLKRLVTEIDSHHEIVEILKSNAEVHAFFTASVAVDLILADIQLGDGLSFESMKSAPNDIPIVFTTAYDHYAVQAFKFNSIDYLLKPIDIKELSAVLNKVQSLHRNDTAVILLPADTEVMITCDKPESDGTCPLDATGNRELAYLGYVKNNTSYDYSTEMARLGMAFSNTKFPSSKRRQICMAQKEAQSSHVGIWSTGGLSQMGSGKRNGLKNMDKLCQKAMQ